MNLTMKVEFSWLIFLIIFLLILISQIAKTKVRGWYKLGFCREIMKACNELTKKEKLIICGDCLAHKPIDLAHPKKMKRIQVIYLKKEPG